MKISVAMCTYNGAAFVQDQLHSIAAQSRLPDELVVCDDGSTDASIDLVEAFARTAPFAVRFYRNEARLGLIRNFEKAIGLCMGDAIALADQDDVWYPHKVQRLESILTSSPAIGLVFSDAEVVDEQMRPLGFRLWQTKFPRRDRKQMAQGKAFDVLSTNNVVTGATMAFKARFKPLVLPIPTDLGILHDAWIALLISAVGKVAFTDEALIMYRQHARQQVGAGAAPKQGVRQTLARSRQTLASLHMDEARRFMRVRQRLIEHGEEFPSGTVLDHLAQRIRHLRVRAALPEQRWQRVWPVLLELLAMRYQHYSRGLYSALRDLV